MEEKRSRKEKQEEIVANIIYIYILASNLIDLGIILRFYLYMLEMDPDFRIGRRSRLYPL